MLLSLCVAVSFYYYLNEFLFRRFFFFSFIFFVSLFFSLSHTKVAVFSVCASVHAASVWTYTISFAFIFSLLFPSSFAAHSKYLFFFKTRRLLLCRHTNRAKKKKRCLFSLFLATNVYWICVYFTYKCSRCCFFSRARCSLSRVAMVLLFCSVNRQSHHTLRRAYFYATLCFAVFFLQCNTECIVFSLIISILIKSRNSFRLLFLFRKCVRSSLKRVAVERFQDNEKKAHDIEK